MPRPPRGAARLPTFAAPAMSPQPAPASDKIDILVSNDDGITALGILALAEAVQEFGRVAVVAPDSPQSGMGHAISVGRPLRLARHKFLEPALQGTQAWACSGTPADCVKLATAVVLQHKPALVLSGINHGSNSSVSVFYSGTLSAAREGTIAGIPSIGFSLCNYRPDADFTAAREVVRAIVRQVLAQGIPAGVVLNVNIPDLPLDKIQGIRVTRQAEGRFVEEFDQRVDPYGRNYYWLTGRFHNEDTGEPDTDEAALAAGYVSVCPALIDITARHALRHLSGFDFRLG